MKKRVLSIVIALVMVFTVISVAAPTAFAEDTHTHTFSNEWTINTTGHWHECTAEGCNIKDYSTCGLEGVAYSKHTGLTDDNTCDVCGEVFYRPYDVTYTDSTINFKVNVLDRNSEPYTKADCMRFDVFLRANNSGTAYDANMDFDHNGYYNGTEFPIYENPSSAGYCVKNGATYTVVLNAGSVDRITDFDENNPYVWIILRPGMYNNCMDYGGGYSLNMTYANFYNCSICLGKFGSLEDFQDVNPDIPDTLDGVISVTEKTTPAIDSMVTLEVLVSQPATKIQLIDKNGNTSTFYDGYDRVISIVENDDGTQLWTINKTVRSLSESYTVIPKFGKTWTPEGSYEYTMSDNNEYTGTVYSVEIPDKVGSAVTVGRHEVIVETAADVTKVQFAYLGTTATLTASNAAIEEKDGHLFWSYNLNFCKSGEATLYDINTRTKATSFEYSGVSFNVDIVKAPISVR